jgi:predicted dehydrogenase
MVTGHEAPHDVAFRLIGSEGVVEVADKADFGLRMMNGEAAGWQTVMAEAPLHGPDHHADAIRDLIDCLGNGREPELSARKALQATELIFATYESARRGGRIDLPLAIDDSPIQALIEEYERSVSS